MKALIFNSGIGKRMGEITKNHPKCMTLISDTDTIVSRQLKLLSENGIEEVVMTTGPFEESLIAYCNSLGLPLKIFFVNNPIYDKTNYIYSFYLARDLLKDTDIIMMHGDLVFDEDVLKSVINSNRSVMTVSSTLELPEKDFKAVVHNNKIEKVGIEFFDDAYAAQPLYKFNKEDFSVWLRSVKEFCENNKVNCYAENAFNVVSDQIDLTPFDVEDQLCNEIDNPDDLELVKNRLYQRTLKK